MYTRTHFPRMLLSATPLESWSNPLSVDSTSEPGLPRRTISTRVPQHTLPTPKDRLRRRWLTSSGAPRVTYCGTRQRPPLRDSWNSRYPNGWRRRSRWRKETAASGYCSNNETSALWKMATHTNTPPRAQELIQPVPSLGQQAAITFGLQVADVDAFLAPACRQGRASGTPKFRATSLTFPDLLHTPSGEKQTSDKSSHSLTCLVQKKWKKDNEKRELRG